MRFDNTIERISFLLSMMTNANDTLGGEDFTIRSASEIYKIPVETIRKDLVFFADKPFFGSAIFCLEDDETLQQEIAEVLGDKLKDLMIDTEDTVQDIMEHISLLELLETEDCTGSSSAICKMILEGKMDKIRIQFDPGMFGRNNHLFMLPLTGVERGAAGRWFEGREPLYISKEVPARAGKAMEKNVMIINEAILDHASVICDYEDRNCVKSSNISFIPAAIRISSQNPTRAFCILENGLIMNISRMSNVRRGALLGQERNIESAFGNDWDAIWEVPAPQGSPEAQTFHVVIHIYQNTPNLIEKIRSDIALRTKGTLNSVEGENWQYVYEDDISGFQEFYKWLWSYGSSMQVIKPQWLADKIIADFDKIQEQYRLGEFIG